MTDKMRTFVREYMVDMNATAAAARAKYADPNVQGPRLLNHPDVQEALAEFFAEKQERVNVTEADVIQGLLREAKDYSETGSPNARVKAWDSLGRHLGMFREAEVPPVPAVILPDPLTPEQWAAKHGDNETDPNLN